MKEKMSRWGVGPVFAFWSVVYGAFILGMSYYFFPFFRFPLLPQWLLSVLGGLLWIVGIPFFLVSVKTVMKAYNADSLVTGGIYGCCRHPLYSAWVVFFVPGVILWMNTWIGLTVPIFMYILLSKLVRKEEEYLEQAFGSEYVHYKKKVPCILPWGYWKSFRHKKDLMGVEKRG